MKRVHLFYAAFITVGVMPVLPIGFEALTRGWPSNQTILVVAAVYSITVGAMTESNPGWAMLGVICSLIFSVSFGFYAASQEHYPTLRIETIVALIIIPAWMLLAYILLKKSFVQEGRSLWGITAPL
jgi:hypothetical protein